MHVLNNFLSYICQIFRLYFHLSFDIINIEKKINISCRFKNDSHWRGRQLNSSNLFSYILTSFIPHFPLIKMFSFRFGEKVVCFLGLKCSTIILFIMVQWFFIRNLFIKYPNNKCITIKF